MAYDASDNTLWLSEDWGHVVFHTQTDGTPISDWAIDLGDGQPLDNSGIAVVEPYLLLGHPADTTHGPAANQVYVFEKDGTYTGMLIDAIALVEDMELGRLDTTCVLWTNNAVTNEIVAYELTGLTPECPIEVNIDIKPGSFPNSINLKSKGVIPVAILGSATFDVTTVDPSTLEFAGASPVHWAFEDVNEDGFMDLISHYRTQDTNIAPGDTKACLTGQLTDASFFKGCDSINIVQP